MTKTPKPKYVPFELDGKPVRAGTWLKVVREQPDWDSCATSNYPRVGIHVKVAPKWDQCVEYPDRLTVYATNFAMGYRREEEEDVHDSELCGLNLLRSTLGGLDDEEHPLIIEPLPITKDLTPLDLYVRRAMLVYPSMYDTRAKVLAQLYLVLGNGIDWNGDRLADRGGGFEHRPPHKRGLRMNFKDVTTNMWSKERQEKMFGKDLEDDTEWSKNFYAKLFNEEQAKIEAKIPILQEREQNIDHWCSYVDPTASYKGSHYDTPWGALSYYREPDYPGYRCTINLWDIPEEVEQSFYDGACEVMDILTRSHPWDTSHLDERGKTEVLDIEGWDKLVRVWNEFRRSRKPSGGKHAEDIISPFDVVYEHNVTQSGIGIYLSDGNELYGHRCFTMREAVDYIEDRPWTAKIKDDAYDARTVSR